MTRSGKMQATHHLGIVNRCALIKGKDTEKSIQSSSMYLCTADNCVMLDCKCIGFMDYLLHLKYMHQNCKIKLQVILYIGLQHMGWGGHTRGGGGGGGGVHFRPGGCRPNETIDQLYKKNVSAV